MHDEASSFVLPAVRFDYAKVRFREAAATKRKDGYRTATWPIRSDDESLTGALGTY
jgi:hypothetical protein